MSNHSYKSYSDAGRFAESAESLAYGFAGVAARAWSDAYEVTRADAAQAAVYHAASARLHAARLKLARADAAAAARRRDAAARERDAQRLEDARRARLLAQLAA
ncbi:hypothetical protein ACYQR9_15460 [Methylobacterium sp. CM6241]